MGISCKKKNRGLAGFLVSATYLTVMPIAVVQLLRQVTLFSCPGVSSSVATLVPFLQEQRTTASLTLGGLPCNSLIPLLSFFTLHGDFITKFQTLTIFRTLGLAISLSPCPFPVLFVLQLFSSCNLPWPLPSKFWYFPMNWGKFFFLLKSLSFLFQSIC